MLTQRRSGLQWVTFSNMMATCISFNGFSIEAGFRDGLRDQMPITLCVQSPRGPCPTTLASFVEPQ